MNKITSIKQLINCLSECDQNGLNEVYQLLEIPKNEFEPYQFWMKKRYTRNCIVKTDAYELLLLCWQENQHSAVHSHNNQECWMYIVDGKFEEVRYELNNDTLHIKNEMPLIETAYSYMTDNMGYHDIRNVNNGKSMSLHLYAKPLEECQVYNKDKKCLELKKLNYDSVDGQPTEYYQL